MSERVEQGGPEIKKINPGYAWGYEPGLFSGEIEQVAAEMRCMTKTICDKPTKRFEFGKSPEAHRRAKLNRLTR